MSENDRIWDVIGFAYACADAPGSNFSSRGFDLNEFRYFSTFLSCGKSLCFKVLALVLSPIRALYYDYSKNIKRVEKEET